MSFVRLLRTQRPLPIKSLKVLYKESPTVASDVIDALGHCKRKAQIVAAS